MSIILFIVTANDCNPCIVFKDNSLNKLKELISKENNIEIIHKNIESRSRPEINDNIHPNLKHGVPMYPFISIFKRNDFYNYSKELSGYLMQGNFINGKYIKIDNTKFNMDPNNIINWIKNTYNYNNNNNNKKYRFFSKNQMELDDMYDIL